MRRPLQVLAVCCTALAASTIYLAAGCSVPDDSAPMTDAVATTESPFPETETVDGMALEARIPAAVATAVQRGAEVDFAMLDRRTGVYVAHDDAEMTETASVVKLFIADEVLHTAESLQQPVPDDDLTTIASMLRSSDDDAANRLWYAYGGSNIVENVSLRYGLTNTAAPWDGQWWNTTTTAADLVRYYDELLDGTGGLSAQSAATLMSFLRTSTPIATDGYEQTFGIVDGLPAESAHAVKQGWMCCIADRWLHLSTGTVGDDDRFVLVVVSRELVHYEDDMERYPDTAVVDVTDDSSARHARDTLTGVVTLLFPDGRID